MKQWKRLAALSSAIVMAAATLTYFPSDTLQNISWKITASAETTTEPQVWNEDNLTWTLDANGTLTISGTGAMKAYDSDDSPAIQKKDSVKTVVIEDGVTSIGDSAFFRCSQLASIEIPSSVTSIGDAAFSYCSKLASINIPSSVTSIGVSAFQNCRKLASIEIPSSVTSIGISAFSHCNGLTSVNIPSSVTSIGVSAFSGTPWLTKQQEKNSLVTVNGILIDGTTCSGGNDSRECHKYRKCCISELQRLDQHQHFKECHKHRI